MTSVWWTTYTYRLISLKELNNFVILYIIWLEIVWWFPCFLHIADQKFFCVRVQIPAYWQQYCLLTLFWRINWNVFYYKFSAGASAAPSTPGAPVKAKTSESKVEAKKEKSAEPEKKSDSSDTPMDTGSAPTSGSTGTGSVLHLILWSAKTIILWCKTSWTWAMEEMR